MLHGSFGSSSEVLQYTAIVSGNGTFEESRGVSASGLTAAPQRHAKWVSNQHLLPCCLVANHMVSTPTALQLLAWRRR